jgi:hypothetical protein
VADTARGLGVFSTRRRRRLGSGEADHAKRWLVFAGYETEGFPNLHIPMSLPKKRAASRASTPVTIEKSLRVRLKALEIPPIKDGIVIGRDAAMGGDAMLRTLKLMTNEKFERLAMKDDVIQDVIIRAGVLRKLGEARLLEFVIARVKPLMTENELLMLDIEVELVIDDSL